MFLSSKMSRPPLGSIQPPNECLPGVLSLEVKWPEREADHLPTSSAKVKNEWSYTSTPPICLHGMYRDNFLMYTIKYAPTDSNLVQRPSTAHQEYEQRSRNGLRLSNSLSFVL
jgi:hypothetical protein